MSDEIKKPFGIMVKNCARCGEDHDMVMFSPFARCPPDDDGWEGQVYATHFADCPTLHQPILMTIQEVQEGQDISEDSI